jgi:hypothetical protein
MPSEPPKSRREGLLMQKIPRNIARALVAVLAALEEFGHKCEPWTDQSPVANPCSENEKRHIRGLEMSLYKVRIPEFVDGDIIVILGMSQSRKSKEGDRRQKRQKTVKTTGF